ncbi:hypothetical protein TNIN_350041 [Trichonephila inaurata madagascariensis]|uniref:Uncharacterized protein n=1 Tax=Trichonephila inaurata madagascariensis TaxID=2747483 RepID=A0A8X6IMN5_9ARAC|nr:hypothetical protein TNIN_350041 [Trichonephila inaurata madagascariensis]
MDPKRGYQRLWKSITSMFLFGEKETFTHVDMIDCMDGKPLSDKFIKTVCPIINCPFLKRPCPGPLKLAHFILYVKLYLSLLYKAMLSDIATQFFEELNALRLPLEQIPISQRQLQLSQWIRYILLSSNTRLNIKLAAIIKKNVDKLSSLNHLDKEIQQWFNALKPEGKVDLVTESYLFLLFMLHLRFIYEMFPVKIFEIKFIALKVAESFLEALDEFHGTFQKTFLLLCDDGYLG